MAMLLHPCCRKETNFQLNLISVPLDQTCQNDENFTEKHSASILTLTKPVELSIGAENSNCIDLANTFLYVQASVTAANKKFSSISKNCFRMELFYIYCGYKSKFTSKGPLTC